jgi:23S rRNA (adenine1618-N6)-methyltransferase
LGNAEYNWNFVATDIDKDSIKCAKDIVFNNNLEDVIELRLQHNSAHVLNGVINETDMFTVSMCNPPFYKSEQEAMEATTKKLKGLNKDGQLLRNFSGTQNELCYPGGEKAFVHNYLYESTLYKNQCIWFTTLVSKNDLVKGMYSSLKKLGASNVKTISMGQGHKISRFVAWTFQ